LASWARGCHRPALGVAEHLPRRRQAPQHRQQRTPVLEETRTIHIEQLALILFVYGLAFFTMGLAVLLEVRPDSELPLARHIRPLAAFGLLHGLVEWLEMFSLVHYLDKPVLQGLALQWLEVGVLASSTLALAWFGATLLAESGGRWQVARWAPLGLLILWIALVLLEYFFDIDPADDWPRWAGIWARYLLYFPGAAMAAVALMRQAPALKRLGMPAIAMDCRWAALAFGVNAVIAGLVVPSGGFPPASILNSESFAAVVGLPPQLFRGMAALAIAFFVVRILRLFDLRLNMEREQFANQALTAQEEERKRIARELHDETAQILSSLLVRLSMLDQARSIEDFQSSRRQLMELATRAVDGVRRLAVELRPPELDDLGLAEALRWYVDDYSSQWGISVHYRPLEPAGRLSPPVELGLYRVAQEALSNVAKHSHARHVSLSLSEAGGSVVLAVEDDGVGFDVPAKLSSKRHGMGLFGMSERMTLLGGKLRFESVPGKGTRVEAVVPVSVAEVRG
jgi:signal transduction histidine kinase